MSGAYWIARVTITDPELYGRYMAIAPAAFARYGGRLVARGVPDHAPEGDRPDRVAVIAFDSMDQALACFHSADYAAARAEREGAAKVDIVIMEACAQ